MPQCAYVCNTRWVIRRTILAYFLNLCDYGLQLCNVLVNNISLQLILSTKEIRSRIKSLHKESKLLLKSFTNPFGTFCALTQNVAKFGEAHVQHWARKWADRMKKVRRVDTRFLLSFLILPLIAHSTSTFHRDFFHGY